MRDSIHTDAAAKKRRREYLTQCPKTEKVSQPMNLAELLRRVEPSRLRQLGKLFQLEEDLPVLELVDLAAQELPYCQTEEGGDCIGIDGAYFVVADLVSDMKSLDLLLETKWERREPNGAVTSYFVDPAIQEHSLFDVRMLLALLSIATAEEDELGVPPELNEAKFAAVVRSALTQPAGSDLAPRPSQRPSQFPRSHRPSIPPGFSPTLESVRPKRASARPKEKAAAKQKLTANRELVELVLTLPRNSLIAAAFALSERGSDSHAVSVSSQGRVVLRRDQLGVVEQLFDDVSESIPQLGSSAERAEFEKQLAKNITFYGVRNADAIAVVASSTELGRFPEFYSDERPPPLEQVRGEFSLVAKKIHGPAVQLLFEVFYRNMCATVQSLQHSLGLNSAK